LLGSEHLERLPGTRWKLANLDRLAKGQRISKPRRKMEIPRSWLPR